VVGRLFLLSSYKVFAKPSFIIPLASGKLVLCIAFSSNKLGNSFFPILLGVNFYEA